MQLIQVDELLFVRKSYRNDDDGPFLLQRDSSTPSYYRSASSVGSLLHVAWLLLHAPIVPSRRVASFVVGVT